MEINIQELAKVKPMQKNLFVGDKVYSFNEIIDVVTICQLSNVNFVKPFAIDNKAFDLIKKFANPDLDYADNVLIVKEGKKKFKTKTLENVELPQFNLDNMQSTVVDFDSLKTARKFTSNKDTRPVLTAINLKENGNMYASDSFVLYRGTQKTLEEDENIYKDEDLKSINIPNTFVDLLDKPSTDEFKIKFNDFCVMTKIDNVIYLGRLITGDFPKLNRALDCHAKSTAVYNFNELKDSISFANNVGATKENNGNIICRFKNKGLKCYGSCEFENEFSDMTFTNDFDISITIDKVALLLSSVGNPEKVELKYSASINPIYYFDEKQTIVITPIRKTYVD